MLTTLCIFVVVSLFSRQTFDMDQLLHRGDYAVEEDGTAAEGEEKKGVESGLEYFQDGP